MKTGEALADQASLGGVGGGVGQVKVVIGNGVVGGMLVPGDFSQAVGDLERFGEGFLQLLVIRAGGVELVGAQ